VKLHFIEPGKPVQYAFMESFNGHFPGECLNHHGFISLPDAQQKIEGLEAGLQPGSASSLTAESNPARIHRCRGGSPPKQPRGEEQKRETTLGLTL
jgi:putative transposase